MKIKNTAEVKMRKIFCTVFILILCSCAKPVPLDTSSMLPSKAVYDQTSSEFYLKHRILVGSFEYVGAHKEYGEVTFSNFNLAVTESLAKGGYLASAGDGTYMLTGKIKEVRMPACIFGSCESGSAIEYTLTNIKTGKVAYNELLVVPYTMECPIFMDNQNPLIMEAYKQTVGANIAQLIQILNRKTQDNLK